MEPSEPDPWKPEVHEKYWYLEFWGGGCARVWIGEDFDWQRWEAGNCFKSCELAAQARDKLKEVLLNFHKHCLKEDE
jgi:hypothetical protein